MTRKDIIEQLISRALAEDIGQGDITTMATIDNDKNGLAQIIARQGGIISGIEYAKKVFSMVDPDLVFSGDCINGKGVDVNDVVITIEGKVVSILQAERTALNLLAHLSGIATLTAHYAEEIKGTRAKVTDTRKTTPLWRELEKEAVRDGGGLNHRMGLYDMVLIKENHILAAGGISEAVKKCREYLSDRKINSKIEVETTNLDQVKEALSANVDQIMLDNMDVSEMKEAVNIIAGKAIVEASGGISLGKIKAVAEAGVDLISVGALTHSAPVFDLSLLIKGMK
jgi:nicotinate-nucleotide pyrophosphorylase (carboxylating)